MVVVLMDKEQSHKRSFELFALLSNAIGQPRARHGLPGW